MFSESYGNFRVLLDGFGMTTVALTCGRIMIRRYFRRRLRYSWKKVTVALGYCRITFTFVWMRVGLRGNCWYCPRGYRVVARLR